MQNVDVNLLTRFSLNSAVFLGNSEIPNLEGLSNVVPIVGTFSVSIVLVANITAIPRFVGGEVGREWGDGEGNMERENDPI